MELHAHTSGEGEPLVILHGLFGSSDNWRTLARRFSKYFETHLLDLRNHGRSPHDAEMTYEAMATDVGWYITSEGLAPVHVLGHSMGGKVAMWLTLQHPDLVNKLIVADIAPREHPAGHHDILEALCSLDLVTLPSRERADELIRDRVPEPRVRKFLLKNLHRKRSGGFEWKLNLPAIKNNYDSIRGWPGSSSMRSEKEALFISGTRSDYVTEDDSDAIMEIFPRARFVDIEAGHWLHADKPRQFFKHCLSFLNETS
jgi:pimeloyl-ACP methyl ester carboxylesterase